MASSSTSSSQAEHEAWVLESMLLIAGVEGYLQGRPNRPEAVTNPGAHHFRRILFIDAFTAPAPTVRPNPILEQGFGLVIRPQADGSALVHISLDARTRLLDAGIAAYPPDQWRQWTDTIFWYHYLLTQPPVRRVTAVLDMYDDHPDPYVVRVVEAQTDLRLGDLWTFIQSADMLDDDVPVGQRITDADLGPFADVDLVDFEEEDQELEERVDEDELLG